MLVIVVDEGLKILDLYHLPAVLPILNQRVDLQGLGRMLSEQLLDLDVVKELVLCQPQDLEGLLFCDKASLDSESLLGDLLSASVRIL